MNYLKVADAARRYSNNSGTFMFFGSVVGVVVNFYIPNIVPTMLIGGMYWTLSLSTIGIIWLWLQNIRNPHSHHAVGEKCPKCQNNLLNTGIKCSNIKCDYEVKF